MRILVTFTGGGGHFRPLVPPARALTKLGHDVLVAAQPAMLATVAAAGFATVDSGGDTLAAPQARGPLRPVDRAHEADVLRRVFAGRIARERAARLVGIAAEWGADVVVRDEVDFGAAVAAERLGLPHAAVIVLAAGGLLVPDLVAGPLDALRSEHGLAPDPDLAMLHRHLTLLPVPRSYRTPSDPLPATARFVQPDVLDVRGLPHDAATARVLDRLASRPGRPVVYATLGTVFPQESGDLITRLLDALGGLDAEVVLTLGPALDPAELGPLPSNVQAERFVAQAAVLPHCAAVVCHAGSGSVVGALAFGRPLVLLPMGADQPQNADRCTALGVARALDPVTATARAIRAAVADVLADPTYAAAAERLRDELAGAATAATAAEWIAELARRGP